MSITVKLQAFEGPLDLLLHLIDKNKVNIYEQNGIKYAFLAYTTSLNGYLTKDYLVNMYSSRNCDLCNNF